MKTLVPTFLIITSLACFAFLQEAQAVSPPPDGGYAGGNTAEGQLALGSLTTGIYNTAVGIYSLLSITDGDFCTGVGAGTLLVNTADQNTATGAGALLSNTTGDSNTAVGTFALFSNTEGSNNTALGKSALLDNIGSNNTAIGTGALFNNQADGNTATGFQALSINTTGSQNTANGTVALFSNTTGEFNTATGAQALFSNTTGDQNTAFGFDALAFTSTGINNTALGYAAGFNLTTGDNNIDIGYNVQGVAGESNTIRIGNTDITTTIIGGISGQTLANGATVLVAANGQLGTMTSSARFKQEIKPMDKTSEAILALKPVTLRYKKEFDSTGIAQFGLVAEDVEKVNPDLVVRDKEGKPYSVRYDQVNAMLLNEFLKEHCTLQNGCCRGPVETAWKTLATRTGCLGSTGC